MVCFTYSVIVPFIMVIGTFYFAVAFCVYKHQLLFVYLPIFESAAMVFVSHSVWGGWHHVEVHPAAWWQARFAAAGLVYSEHLTARVKKLAQDGWRRREKSSNGAVFRAQHIRTNMLVFLNPSVMRRPEHAHLIGGAGCFGGKIGDDDANLPCESPRAPRYGQGLGDGDKLPAQFLPLPGAFKSDAEVGWKPPQCRKEDETCVLGNRIGAD